MEKINKHLLLIILISILFTKAINPQNNNVDLEKKLIEGVMALSPQIKAVRPCSVYEPSQPKFKYQWYPAVTLKKGTAPSEEEAIAKKTANFVVDFQKGVLIDGVMGGLLVIFEGDGWTPRICQVFYRIIYNNENEDSSPTIEVWTSSSITDESGNVSCGDDDKIIGYIINDKFK